MIKCDYKVERTTVTKNNGVVLNGIVFRKESDYCSPVIYIDDLLEDDLSDEQIEDIAFYRFQRMEGSLKINKNDITCFENIKSTIFPRVINKERNQAFLESAPHYDFLSDLVVIYCAEVSSDSTGVASFRINNQHLEMWNITEDYLNEVAMKNLEGREVVIYDLAELVGLKLDIQSADLKVVTYKNNLYGAACLLNSNCWYNFPPKNKTHILIPSSIHEIILAPCDEDMDLSSPDWSCKYDEMIREVNETALNDTDILSDHAYLLVEGGKIFG